MTATPPLPPRAARAFRLRATLVHLGLSALVAALAAALVFGVWYPGPLAALAGGTTLFLILVSVDVVIGPALTAVVADARKPRRELWRDLAVIALLQLAAFAYGLHTMAVARPAVLAFEVDLLRVVAANEVDHDALPSAPPGLRTLSWTGPVLLAAVKPADAAEQLRTIELGLAGVPLAALPPHWRPYADHAPAAWARARPLDGLLQRHPALRADAARIAADAGVELAALRTLPLMTRRAEWTAVLAPPDARVVGYLPVVDDR